MSLGIMRSLKRFYQAAPADFDGFWGWEEVENAFPGAIRPTDIDGLVERKGNFLLFETKTVMADGTLVPVPVGQRITLKALHSLGCFTIAVIWCKGVEISVGDGLMKVKEVPMYLELWRRTQELPDPVKPVSMSDLVTLCKGWYAFADSHPAKKMSA